MAARGPPNPFIQSQASFDAAIANTTTSPSYVLITVTDQNTNITRAGCLLAPSLLRAIHVEHAIGYDTARIAAATAMASSAHEFGFKSQDALRNVGFQHLESQNPKACALLRAGHSAYQADITGAIREGLPY